ncbi:carbohydrate ABC transporter permease, partial [Micromonospora deserti]
MRHGKYPFIVGFLAAPVALYTTFVIGPYLQAFYLAMTNWRGVAANPTFIGLDNFRRLLQDEVFWKAVRHHGLLLLAMPLITIAIALIFAFLLNVGGGARSGAMA